MWWIIIAIVLCFLAYLLLAPFYLEIDSNHDLYRIRFHHLASASLVLNEESLFLKLKIAWWKKEFDLLITRRKKHVEKINRKSSRKKEISVIKIGKKIKGIMKSFRINTCYILLDTGNQPLNGILYPAFYMLSRYSNKSIMINFWEENQITLQIENNIARVLYAYIKS